MVTQPPRSLEQRRDDILDKLINDGDVWVATVGEDGAPYLVPLSFLWWDGKVVVATPESNPTG